MASKKKTRELKQARQRVKTTQKIQQQQKTQDLTVKSRKKIKGQIGHCDNSQLKGVKNISRGHYVYIRKVDRKGNCIVSTVTSLEDESRNFKLGKIRQVRKGNIYPIPKPDATFERWSGINKTTHSVHVSKIKEIGKHTINRKHKFMIAK